MSAIRIGRYQFIWWPRWVFVPYHKVTEGGLRYIYDHFGIFGPIEIRRFVKPSKGA